MLVDFLMKLYYYAYVSLSVLFDFTFCSDMLA